MSAAPLSDPNPPQDVPNFGEIQETFELLDDWEERYRYVIDLGKAMEGLAEERRIPALKVDGCASQVWIDMRVDEDADGVRRFRFDGDSDALIVRGLIAVLRALLSGRPPGEIAAADPLAAMADLGLGGQLSAQRSNGLRAMVERLKSTAAAAA
ncbi:MAG: SufE family protein [Pseudomonadota bacterium]